MILKAFCRILKHPIGYPIIIAMLIYYLMYLLDNLLVVIFVLKIQLGKSFIYRF
jgi:hypothetical protein